MVLWHRNPYLRTFPFRFLPAVLQVAWNLGCVSAFLPGATGSFTGYSGTCSCVALRTVRTALNNWEFKLLRYGWRHVLFSVRAVSSSCRCFLHSASCKRGSGWNQSQVNTHISHIHILKCMLCTWLDILFLGYLQTLCSWYVCFNQQSTLWFHSHVNSMYMFTSMAIAVVVALAWVHVPAQAFTWYLWALKGAFSLTTAVRGLLNCVAILCLTCLALHFPHSLC